ncbi:hypothetical protein [Lentzea jiangxiensis]|uniref:hypothetical protein n=1 Tax=Lentzea jiangxiensis TaxID=641025 RepID=UPI000B219658|nr:hypothetical protein [Lentzea jiangxiensis]
MWRHTVDSKYGTDGKLASFSATSTCSNPATSLLTAVNSPVRVRLPYRLTEQHGLVDLFQHLHPDQVEHSWARRPELGYRYDHAHGSRALADRLMTCEYVHETRENTDGGARLTDHSGLAVRFELSANRTLTSDPTKAVDALTEPEPTLF